MTMLSRRSLLASSAVLAAGLGFGRALAQSDETATLKLQAFGGDAELAGDQQRHRAASTKNIRTSRSRSRSTRSPPAGATT